MLALGTAVNARVLMPLLWLLACHLQAACDSVLMDYDSLREQHSDLGTAAVIVMVGGDGANDSCQPTRTAVQKRWFARRACVYAVHTCYLAA
jgi:NADH:ubiquinone oxidoreductase subunit F (NADH-binding)